MGLHQTLLNGCSRGALVTGWPPGKICGQRCFQTISKSLHQVRCSRRSYQSLEASLLPPLIACENFILTETFVNKAGDAAGSSSRISQAAAPPSGHPNKRTISTWGGDDGGGEDSPSPKTQGMGTPWNVSRVPLYACPYQKRYPVETPFCGFPHGSRREFGWDSVTRVK